MLKKILFLFLLLIPSLSNAQTELNIFKECNKTWFDRLVQFEPEQKCVSDLNSNELKVYKDEAYEDMSRYLNMKCKNTNDVPLYTKYDENGKFLNTVCLSNYQDSLYDNNIKLQSFEDLKETVKKIDCRKPISDYHSELGGYPYTRIYFYLCPNKNYRQ